MPYFRMPFSLDSTTLPSTSDHVMPHNKHHNGNHGHDFDRAYGNQFSSNGSTNGDTIVRRSNVGEVTEDLANYLLDCLVLESCFEVHQEACLLAEANQPMNSLDPDPDGQLFSGLHNYIPPKPMNADEMVVQCPQCPKTMSVKIFAQHLEQHSGGGRNSSRTARKRMAEEHQLNNLRLGSSDDETVDIDSRLLSPMSNNDDDDWQMSKKKKRQNPKAKKKR